MLLFAVTQKCVMVLCFDPVGDKLVSDVVVCYCSQSVGLILY